MALKIIDDIKAHYHGEVDIRIFAPPRGEYKHIANNITEMWSYEGTELERYLNELGRGDIQKPLVVFFDQQCEKTLAKHMHLWKQNQPTRPIYIIATVPYPTVKENVLSAFDVVIPANRYSIVRQIHVTLKE